jgi:hypothetical protein
MDRRRLTPTPPSAARLHTRFRGVETDREGGGAPRDDVLGELRLLVYYYYCNRLLVPVFPY